MFSTNPQGLEVLIQLIASRTGLHMRPQDQAILYKKVFARLQALHLKTIEQYCQLLASSDIQSDREWQTLVALLTTGESYLFRDQGQLALLKNQLLPELIHNRRAIQRKQGASRPSLKIWSAGCSTGEEAYSLAILIWELIPKLEEWDICILGTDINPQAVQKAAQGLYNSWSFRMVSPGLQEQYFHRQGNLWKIDHKLQRMVTFQTGNLVKDPFPNTLTQIHDIDLIVCRNVFIYFNAESIALVLQKFERALKPQGYLVVGHAELFGQKLGGLKTKVFPESIVYQRSDDQPTLPKATTSPAYKPLTVTATDLDHLKAIHQPLSQRSPTSSLPLTSETSLQHTLGRGATPTPTTVYQSASQPVYSTDSKPQLSSQAETYRILIQEAENLMQKGDYKAAIASVKQAMQLCASVLEPYYLTAKAYANLGQYQEAKSYCQQAVKIDASALPPHYLLARIAEEQNSLEEAKSVLRKIIYLDSEAIAAYLELGSIYAKEQNKSKSQKMWKLAFDLLKRYPSNKVVENFHEIMAGELLLQVKKLLSKP